MKTLVESCFCVDTKLLKRDLKRAREHKIDITGFINISWGSVKAVVDYSIEYGTENDYLVISYGETEQRIKLAESELRFGPRSWFICDCDRRVSKLYLPPYSKEFKCRHKFSYELTTLNRKSKTGQLAYHTNRMIKLMNTRETMRSFLYNGKPTARFERFLTFSDKVGVVSNRKDAEKLLEAINA